MSFLYPRTIAVTRPQERPGQSAAKPGYGGSSIVDEQVVAAQIPASIQFNTTARGTGAQIPSDPRSMVDFKILIPKAKSPRGMVQVRDVVTDDLGERYQVYAAYWSPMGYNLRATLLQV